jgi:carboxymethylenebutenolidase
MRRSFFEYGGKVKILKLILRGIIILALGAVLFLGGSIAIDYAIGGERINAVTNTTIPGGNGTPEVRAYVAAPSGEGPFPVVIMIHEFFGLNQSIVGKAKGLAEEGYLVIAPDTFRGSTTAWVPRAIYQVITNQPEQVNQDLDAVYAWIEDQPNMDPTRIAVSGFCYGGRASLNYSLHNPGLAATVIFYGSPVTDPQVLQALPGPVLGIFGGADASIPVADVRAFETALDQAGIRNEITIYENQPHAFVTDMEAIRAGGVQAEAWQQMVEFLNRNLKGDADPQAHAGQSDYRAAFDWRYYLMLAYEHALGTASHSH